MNDSKREKLIRTLKAQIEQLLLSDEVSEEKKEMLLKQVRQILSLKN